jgi:UDP-N-acetyl-D-glucosamine dehydrogenase
VVIVTDHRDINYEWVVEHSLLVIDSRNATRNVTQNRDKIMRLGAPNLQL